MAQRRPARPLATSTRWGALAGAWLLLASAAAAAETAAEPDPNAGVSPSAQSPATPQVSTQPADPSDWEFKLMLYGWASALDATVSAGGFTSEPNESFLDLLDDLQWAIEGGGEVRYQRALLLFDVIGMQLQVKSSSSTRTRPFDPPPPGGSVGELTVGPLSANVRTTIWTFEVAPGWRVLSLPVSDLLGTKTPDDPRRLDLDAYSGIRYWNAKNSVRANIAPGSLTIDGMTIGLGGLDIPDIDFGPITVPGAVLSGGQRHATATVDWVDWVLGTRIRGDLTEHVSAFLIGEFGGFGLGNSSSPTWQAAGGFNWAFAEHWYLVLGYRALGVDRSNALESAVLHGPQLGLGVRF